MIRFVFRFVGVMLLALAFLLLVYDGMKSIADGRLYFTALGPLWLELNAASHDSMRGLVEQQGAGLWAMMVEPVLSQPAFAIFAVLAGLIILIGRRKRRLIGYARD